MGQAIKAKGSEDSSFVGFVPNDHTMYVRTVLDYAEFSGRMRLGHDEAWGI